MKKYLLPFLLLLALLPAAHAQMGLNAPAGLAPVRDMEIYSRDVFVVQQKYIPTTDPISGTFTLSCASPPSITASAGVLLDPGGTGNYPPSLTCTQTVVTPGNSLSVGYELTFTQFGTEANGDSVVISDLYGGRVAFSGNTLPPVLLVPGDRFLITFKTDNDGNVGTGFALRWRRVSLDPAPTGTGDNRFGKALQFDLVKGSLVGGFNGVGALQRAGNYSTALGVFNTASGNFSTALGIENRASGESASALGGGNRASGDYASALGGGNRASGDYATALGRGNRASGNSATTFGRFNTATAESSTAFGDQNLASGIYSLATGYFNIASGNYSTAMGLLNIASGNYSTAMGYRMNTNGQAGAFMIGDSDPLVEGETLVGFPDQFVGRFRNGYYLMTSGDINRTGVLIGAGQNAWGSISDSTKKERLLPMNHADVLRKIGGMKLSSWNYKGQRDIRHYGPMAQDFYAAFGHDEMGQIGCDTLIYSHDFAGVTFAGVQALVRENELLKAELAAVKQDNTQTKADFANRLHLLERAMLTRRERVSLRKTKP